MEGIGEREIVKSAGHTKQRGTGPYVKSWLLCSGPLLFVKVANFAKHSDSNEKRVQVL